jgi:isocitrate dehydrogenase
VVWILLRVERFEVKNTIIYTFTDEAPALATRAFFPILQAFVKPLGLEVSERDISLAGRILAAFPECLEQRQRCSDALAELGELVKRPDANVIKLPNISASVPQLVDAIAELRGQGYAVPMYPETPQDDAQREVKARYAKVLGSAVNPVIREGNSDRRVAAPVKEYARKNPHSMGAWSPSSKTCVVSMSSGDFYGSELSHTFGQADKLRIELVGRSGQRQVLKEQLSVKAGEVVDASFMDIGRLCDFYTQQFQQASQSGVLLSLHLKTTMMKVSDPVIFGHAVKVYLGQAYQKHSTALSAAGIEPNNGLEPMLERLVQLPDQKKEVILADIQAAIATGPALAMVNSSKGISNLHTPSGMIVDASMAAAIRDGGKMWGPDGKLQDTLMVVPDRCYATFYQAVIDFCKANGAFDPRTMGNVANVGLMAQQAEEYGSHNKTFIIPFDGEVQVTKQDGSVVFRHSVNAGDIWRMCQTADAAAGDWVRLAVVRARATGSPAIFWLDSKRAHDAELITKVEKYLHDHDTRGLDIQILAPQAAAIVTCQRAKQGLDTISVTGNVLRDFLTDLFPILELGTSAKMLSIVPLLAGGSLYETGAGGSAPKHVEQFIEEGHLRWDSIGEFLAIGASLEDFGRKTNQADVVLLGETLNQAIGRILDENKSPERTVGSLDTRGSQFYLALYWAQALAGQQTSQALQSEFADMAQDLAQNEDRILAEINATQGKPTDIGGYYHPCAKKTEAAMRPSQTFNSIINSIGKVPATHAQ